MPVRYARTQALAPSAASIATRHVGRCPGLVNKDQPLGVEVELPLKPLIATPQNVWAFLFGGARGTFFTRDLVAIEEPPQRADANRRPTLGQPRLQLDQRDVILRLDRTEDEVGMRLDPRRPPIATLRLGRRRAVRRDN